MGVSYHANYLVWFELGRTDYLRSLGYSYSELEKSGLCLAVLEAQCRYLSPARYEDELVIETQVEKMKRFKLYFRYRVLRGDELLAEGSTVLGSLSLDLQPKPFPAEIIQKIEQQS